MHICRFADSVLCRAALLCLCLLVRVAWMARFPVDPIGPVDAEGFHLLAVNVAAGRGFAIGWVPPFCPTAVRTPLYPLLLMAVYATLGPDPARAVLAHALLEVLVAALVMRLGREVAGRRAGALAGLLYALNGSTQRYTGYLLSEALLLPLMAAALLATARALRRPVPGRLALAGLTWALATLTKPNVQFLALATGLLLAARAIHGGRVSSRRASSLVLRLSAFFLAFLATLFPWLLRNRLVFERWMLSTAFEENLARVSAVATLAEVRGVRADPWSETWEHLYDQLVAAASERHGWPEPALVPPRCVDRRCCAIIAQRHREVAQGARDLVRRHPGAWLLTHESGVTYSLLHPGHTTWYPALTGRPWSSTGVVENVWARMAWSLERGAVGDALRALWRERVARAPLDAALLWWSLLAGRVAVWAVGLRGLRSLARERGWVATALAGAVAYLLVLPGPIAYDRFYLPAIPAVVVLLAAGAPRLKR